MGNGQVVFNGEEFQCGKMRRVLEMEDGNGGTAM